MNVLRSGPIFEDQYFFMGRHECLQSQLHTPNIWCWPLEMSIFPCLDIVDVVGECRRCLTCSSHDQLKINISSRKTLAHLSMKGQRRLSIYLMKVAGAFIEMKGITNHSNNASLVLKVVFHISMDSIGILWYPDLRSRFVKNLSPFKLSMSSSIHGRGYLFFTEILLRSW